MLLSFIGFGRQALALCGFHAWPCLGRSFGESRHESHPHADECRDTGTAGAFGDLRNSYEENMKL